MTVMAAIAADPDVVVAHAFDRYDLMSNSLSSLGYGFHHTPRGLRKSYITPIS
jgi:hypothetical protein